MMHPRLGSSVWVAALALHIAAPASVHGQGQSARFHGPQWIVASDATTDLLFHSLAVLGVNGPGTLPFYDTRYAQRVSDEKARRGIAPSRLDRDAARLRRAIMADSAFELLHFLPLYLDRMSPEDLPRFLRHAAANPTALAPEEMVRVVRSSLPSSAQRAVLADLADAIDDEWATFSRGAAALRAAADGARRRALQARWDEIFAPRFDEVFRASGVSRGVLLISPALGAEGRVANLRAAGVILAVSDWSGGRTPDAPLLAAIRELCFPLLQHVAEIDDGAKAHAARSAEESSRAAVRCGAQLVDARMPSAAGEYRALFLSARPGETEAGYRERFDRRFQTDAVTLRAISREIARATSRSGASSR
jgi:hypothetical protein